MGLCLPACLACQTLPIVPKTLETHSSVSQTLQDALKRSQLFFLFMLTHRTIPYHIRLCLPYHHTHHKNHTSGIGLATCINSCMCSNLRLALSHDAYVFHARSKSGFCICQLRLDKCKVRSLGHSCFQRIDTFCITGR